MSVGGWRIYSAFMGLLFASVLYFTARQFAQGSTSFIQAASLVACIFALGVAAGNYRRNLALERTMLGCASAAWALSRWERHHDIFTVLPWLFIALVLGASAWQTWRDQLSAANPGVGLDHVREGK